MNKVIALFVEGDTEIEFYKALIVDIRSKNKEPFKKNFEYENLKGIGNYKKDALRKFAKLRKKYPESDIYIFLCYDTDVFELSKKPPVDMENVKELLLVNGAKGVELIKAKYSIEDWFLIDFENVLKFLRLPANTPRGREKGLVKLKKLFMQANRMYIKGNKAEGFVDKLDIGKIRNGICESLKPLCEYIGLDCKKICNKQNKN